MDVCFKYELHTSAIPGFDMMYCVCSKEISCPVTYLFINACVLCVDVAYRGKDSVTNALVVRMGRIHLYCFNGN